MNNTSAEIERLPALRPFDKKGFEETHERIRTQMNTLKSAQRGFNNQDAIAPLLLIALTATESAEKLLDEDPESFDAATRNAAKQACFAINDAISRNQNRMTQFAASAFDAQIESTVMTLGAASVKALGRDLTQHEHDSLKSNIREFFNGVGPMPDVASGSVGMNLGQIVQTAAPAQEPVAKPEYSEPEKLQFADV